MALDDLVSLTNSSKKSSFFAHQCNEGRTNNKKRKNTEILTLVSYLPCCIPLQWLPYNAGLRHLQNLTVHLVMTRLCATAYKIIFSGFFYNNWITSHVEGVGIPHR